ncbi:conserved exported hypothetical protein [Bradyrhizobium sp. STM 3843]|uniref:DUF2059 domain-containing protein n=1 Tax=Bradyrhizobium sp. STM 3843 TaxID=551947 RepID=UPI0002407742|nr:DUF2059 domain-containing protein [Bradyrhizobium sp. STM 3843]CCE07266.1 conserved exported hypothetical protein [Bradyrhizobium sp. STM 3843]
MPARILMIVAMVLALTGHAGAQAPSPEALEAARNLVVTMKLADQYKAMLPTILLGIKPVLVQDRPEIERDYEAMAATVGDAYTPFYQAMVDRVAALYASAFTIDELHQIEAFYRTAVGQKLLEKVPALAQQREVVVQDISRKAADELKARLTDALRQKGHKL